MKRVIGLPLPLYLIVLGLSLLALRYGVIPTGLPGGLFLLLVLGGGLNELRKNVPLVRTYFGGSAVCVLGGAAVGVSDLLPKDSTEILGRFIESEGLLIFYIAALITGSLSQVDRWLLFRVSLRILLTAFVGVMAGTAVIVLFGFLQGFSVTESLLYITTPITSGGMTAGATPLSMIYAETSDISADEALTRIVPATVPGSIVSILSGALMVRLSIRFPKLSGDGQLLRGEGAVQRKSVSQANSGNLLTGLLLSLAFYTTDALLHNFISALPAYAGMTPCIMAAKDFPVLPEEMRRAAAIWGQFVTRAFTAAALTGIDIVLLDLNHLASVLALLYLLIIMLGVLVVALTAGFVGSRFMGSHPPEALIVAGVCATSMGGSDSVAVLSVTDCMLLLPSAQIAARNIGALMLTLRGVFTVIPLH